MTEYTPPFTLSANAISRIAEIAALVERFAIRMKQPDALLLRRANKIKSIHSSLAIEGNTLSEEQVSDILNGTPVVAPIRQIQEVRNAIATYDLYLKLNPFSVEDLLKAHGAMMSALVDNPGEFRRSGVGVMSGNEVIHMAPPPHRVSALIADLFDWLKNAKDHLLVKSCVFHYEFEFIHPFADGNGRMGRLWQSLILGKWNPVFQFLPVENMVHANQQAYYDAINASTERANSAPFIDFMLGEIFSTLQQRQHLGGISGGISGGLNWVFDYVRENPGLRANAIAAALHTPQRTLDRHLKTLRDQGKISFVGAKKTGGYHPVEKEHP
jgi:Fic family protein